MSARGKTVDVYLPEGHAQGLKILGRPFVACQVLFAKAGALRTLVKRPDIEVQGVFVLSSQGQVVARALPDGTGAAARMYLGDAGEVDWAAYVQVTGARQSTSNRDCMRAMAHRLSTDPDPQCPVAELSEAEAADVETLLEETRLMLAVAGA